MPRREFNDGGLVDNRILDNIFQPRFYHEVIRPDLRFPVNADLIPAGNTWSSLRVLCITREN